MRLDAPGLRIPELPRIGDRVVYARPGAPYAGAGSWWETRRRKPSLVVHLDRAGGVPRAASVLTGDRNHGLDPWWADCADLAVIGRASWADTGRHLDADVAADALAGSTVALDFDGPIHSYRSGWTGYEPTDPPTEGALEFVRFLLTAGARVVVHTSRADSPAGRRGVERYLALHGFPELRVTYEKVPAAAYVDDRAVHFDARLRAPYDDALIAEVVRMCLTRHTGEYHPAERTGLLDRARAVSAKYPWNELTDEDLAELREQGYDTESSVSRQHYIDTGRYLAAGEAEESG